MSFKLEILPGEPILLSTLYEDFDFASEIAANLAEAAKLLDASPKPLFVINHVRFKVDMNTLMVGAAATSLGPNALYHHPKLRGVVYATTDPLVKYGAPGLANEIYGNLHIEVVDTLEEALAYVRSQL